MIDNNVIYVFLSLIVSYFIVFGIGLFLGHKCYPKGVSNNSHIGFLKANSQHQDQNSSKPLAIDDSKVVLGLATDGLQKKYDQLGETQKTKEDISSSINKLKNMKG